MMTRKDLLDKRKNYAKVIQVMIDKYTGSDETLISLCQRCTNSTHELYKTFTYIFEWYMALRRPEVVFSEADAAKYRNECNLMEDPVAFLSEILNLEK